MDSLKAWWTEVGEEIFAILALMTVCLTILYYILHFLGSAAAWVVDVTGIYWVLRTWLAISVGYLTYQIGLEYLRYRKNPERYGFWSGEEPRIVKVKTEPVE